MGIKVLPPDVNESWPNFAVVPETGNVRFGLSAIKNVGEKAAEAIVEERKKNGPYKSLEDFVKRLDSSILNKKILESLTKAGALNRFGERTIFLAGMDQILKFAQEARRRQINQLGLFGESSLLLLHSLVPSLPQVPSASKNQKLAWEKELLGMYVSEHPLSDFNHLWTRGRVLPSSNLSEEMIGREVEMAGIITNVQRVRTKNGAEMAFVKIEDIGGGVEVLVFPKIYQESNEILHKDRMVLIKGKVSEKDNVLKILVDQIKEIQEELEKPSPPALKQLYLTIPKGSQKGLLEELKEIVLVHKGDSPLILKMPQDGDFKEIKVKSKVKISEVLLEKLTTLLGADRVEVK